MLDIKLKLEPSHTSARQWMEPSPLRKLYWNITYACNHRCGICFTDAGCAHGDELTTAEALSLVDQAARCGVEDIIISGGEPFARGDLAAILRRMAERNITARIASNGCLLTEPILDELRTRTLTRSFQISLDTLDPDLYRALHGADPGDMHKALRSLRAIRERGFHTTVSVRLTGETIPGIPALLDRAHQERWATVTLHLPVHTRRVQGAPPQNTDALEMLSSALERSGRLAELWVAETYIPWARWHSAIQRMAKRVKIVHCGCRAGRDRLAVHPSGWISPCVCMDVPAAYAGNVRHDALNDVFDRSPVCRLMRQPRDHGLCLSCPHLDLCGGGCRAAALAASGGLGGQDTSCPVRQSAMANPRRADSAAGRTESLLETAP